MIISTEFGNFGSFKDLHIFMKIEGKNSVFISSVNYWGINCLFAKCGTTFVLEEIAEIAENKDELATTNCRYTVPQGGLSDDYYSQ